MAILHHVSIVIIIDQLELLGGENIQIMWISFLEEYKNIILRKKIYH